jgi:hypothetical protein
MKALVLQRNTNEQVSQPHPQALCAGSRASGHDVKSAIRCHIETIGRAVLEVESPAREPFVAETPIDP